MYASAAAKGDQADQMLLGKYCRQEFEHGAELRSQAAQACNPAREALHSIDGYPVYKA